MELSDILKLTNSDEYIEIVNLRYKTIKKGIKKDLQLESNLLNCKVLRVASLNEDVSDYNGILIIIKYIKVPF